MKRNKTLKSLIICCCTILVIVITVFIWFSIEFNKAFSPGEIYSATDLIKNFNGKRNELYNVKKYFNSITPKYKKVDIEFADGGKIARLEILPLDTGKGADLTPEFLNWNLSTKTTDSVLINLGWSTEKLMALKEKLEAANCISITNGEPTKIGFKRSGFGMYFFNIFDKSIPDNSKSKYNDSCTFIYASKNLVLEYCGGAVGPQCFFNKGINNQSRN